MVHRTQLEVAPIGQDLLAELLAKNLPTTFEPCVGRLAVEEAAGEYQGLGILEKMIAKKIRFEAL